MANISKNATEKLRVVYRITFALAILWLFLGGFFIFVSTNVKDSNDTTLALIAGVLSILSGILYLVLGVFIRRKSSVALGIAIGFMALNLLFAIGNMIQSGKINFAGFILPTLYVSQAWEGFGAIKELRNGKGS